jgi:hypothetical protein
MDVVAVKNPAARRTQEDRKAVGLSVTLVINTAILHATAMNLLGLTMTILRIRRDLRKVRVLSVGWMKDSPARPRASL